VTARQDSVTNPCCILPAKDLSGGPSVAPLVVEATAGLVEFRREARLGVVLVVLRQVEGVWLGIANSFVQRRRRWITMRVVAGLSERELARVRGRLVEFSGEMFASMKRKDQRGWGEVYVRGLMLDAKRKSIEPIGRSACGWG
jgi:DDE superfamily endonuclease